MANNYRCGCGSRRASDNRYGCLSSLGGRRCWENFPYYDGPCPDAEGIYDCDGADNVERTRRRRRRDCDYGIFTAMLPMAEALKI